MDEGYLVLEKYLRIEVRDFGIYALANHLALARMHELAHLCRSHRGGSVI